MKKSKIEADYGDSYQKNYLRTTIQHLIRLNKPVIIRANYKAMMDESVFVTFKNVRPYIRGKVGKRICDHINLFQDRFFEIYGNYWNHSAEPYQALYLICRPYIYFGHGCKNKRGGLYLTEELGIPPIQMDDQYISHLPQESYVDFSEFAEGEYIQNASLPKCTERNEKTGQDKNRKSMILPDIKKSKRKRGRERRKFKNMARSRHVHQVEKLISIVMKQDAARKRQNLSA